MLRSKPILYSSVALLTLSVETTKVIAEQASPALEEVIVSARRVEESLQETPVAVSAFDSTAIELRNIQSVSEVTNFVPNVQFDSAASESGGGTSSQISIRGIGQTDYAITVEPGVGLYLDGVYIGKSVGSLMDAVDLAGIEVLRGPQGTLFGKNTIGGAILLTSKKPSDEHEFTIDATVGEFSRRDLKVSGNLPVSDSFRVRGSLASLKRDGHVDRVLTDDEQGEKDSLSSRIVADWDISEDLTASFAVDATKTRENSPGQVTVSVDENSFFGSLYNGNAAAFGYTGPALGFAACNPSLGDPARLTNPNCSNSQYAADIDDLDSTNTGPNKSESDVWGASLTLDWSLGEYDLKSITAYRRAEVNVAQELVGVPNYMNSIGQDITLKLFSQEFQFSGTAFDDKLSYIAGLYYSTEKGSQVFPVLLKPVQFISGGTIDNESSAIFGQIGYDLTDTITLTLGARFSDEEKSFTPQQRIINVPDEYEPFWNYFAGITGNGFLVQENLTILPEAKVTRSDTDFTPSVTLDYKFSDTSFVYVSYSEGYKGGGFTLRGFPPIIPGVNTTETDPNKLIPGFAPETAEVFEIGMKTEFFDQRIRLNIAAFNTSYNDVQLTANTGPSAFVPVLINAGDAEMQGLEVEAVILAADWLRLDLGLGYLDSEYDTLSDDAIAAGTTLSSDLPNAPETTATFGATIDFFNDEKGHLFLRTDVSYKSSQFKTVANDPVLEQGSYTLVNATLTYKPDDNWQVTLGGTNLTDEIYIVSGVANAGIGYAQAVVSRPQEWFLGVKYSY